MANFSWRFPNLNGGLEQGINNSGIATFNGSDLYSNLAREICQNSLDAKANGEKTVVVEFKSISVEKNKYDALYTMDDIIDRCREYWKNRTEPKLESFLKEAQNTLSKESIDLLIISDYNTTGLSGAKASPKEKSVWRALTHASGVTEKSNGSGGSYGIGKSAPIACSSLRTVFYNSYAIEDKIRAFQGVSHLVTHNNGVDDTQGVGFYQNTTEQKPIFEEDNCEFRDLFYRNKYGTDVIIIGFKKNQSWKEDIERAIIKNFFVAIHNNKLEVKVEDVLITKSNLKSRIQYYVDKELNLRDSEKEFAIIYELYQALTEPDKEILGSMMENNDVILYIKKDDGFSKKIAEMRSIGMVVRIRSKNIYSRYAAVMFVKEGKLNNLLKNIEPPAHDKWDEGILEEDSSEFREARRYRKGLVTWTNNQIIEFCKIEQPKELDLEGISNFLPFDEDDKDLGFNQEGLDNVFDDSQKSNSPDTISKIGELDKIENKPKKIKLTAKKTIGTKTDEGWPNNDSEGGTRGGKSGIEDPKGNDNITAISKNSTGRALNIPSVIQQRIVKMPSDSMYRAAFVLEKDCDKVNISVKAIGEDGNKEALTILSYSFNKKNYNSNSQIISLKSLKANQVYEVFLKLKYDEKLLLDLLIY